MFLDCHWKSRKHYLASSYCSPLVSIYQNLGNRKRAGFICTLPAIQDLPFPSNCYYSLLSLLWNSKQLITRKLGKIFFWQLRGALVNGKRMESCRLVLCVVSRVCLKKQKLTGEGHCVVTCVTQVWAAAHTGGALAVEHLESGPPCLPQRWGTRAHRA